MLHIFPCILVYYHLPTETNIHTHPSVLPSPNRDKHPYHLPTETNIHTHPRNRTLNSKSQTANPKTGNAHVSYAAGFAAGLAAAKQQLLHEQALASKP